MCKRVLTLGCCAAPVLILTLTLSATTIPRLTFEQLTDASDLIASGRVTQSWGAWDSEHKYIWTHYLLSVSETARGASAASVEFAEPGGTVGDASMMIAGSVVYKVGADVVVFLSRMPNGYLRTTGWAQGKYALDTNGRLHGVAALGGEVTLDGLSLTELKQRVAVRVRATSGKLQ
ncbi:MAG: hypothetical protein M3N54_13500 [Acidobacteriota bacterium]|nr:hypothetical protein [Acidobacteriota bacterium]